MHTCVPAEYRSVSETESKRAAKRNKIDQMETAPSCGVARNLNSVVSKGLPGAPGAPGAGPGCGLIRTGASQEEGDEFDSQFE